MSDTKPIYQVTSPAEIAETYQVELSTVRQMINRHKDELIAKGYIRQLDKRTWVIDKDFAHKVYGEKISVKTLIDVPKKNRGNQSWMNQMKNTPEMRAVTTAIRAVRLDGADKAIVQKAMRNLKAAYHKRKNSQ